MDSPFIIYRLTLNLNPVCDEKSLCLQETCSIEIKQDDREVMTINQDSIQCIIPPPQSTFKSQSQASPNDQEIVENLEKQINLDHEVQTSADHNDRPFIAVPASTFHYCPGCPYDLNPNLPGLSAFGDQIVRSMDESLSSDFKHKVISVLRISRSVPPNANVVRYEILLKIGETTCLRTSLLERSQCLLQSNIPIKLCQVTLEEQPWQENIPRITKNNCTETSLENELNSSLGPNSASEKLDSSVSSSKQEGEEEQRSEFYDQVAQEGKFSTYQTTFNQCFDSPTLKLTIEGDDGTAKSVLVVEPIKKVVLEKDDFPEKTERFVDKTREFDSFLKEFDVLVKEMNSTNTDERIPVVEEIIKPVRLETRSVKEVKGIRNRRSLKGLVDVQNELLVKQLAIKALEILDDKDSDSMKTILLKVLEAKSEEKGNVYHLKLKVYYKV